MSQVLIVLSAVCLSSPATTAENSPTDSSTKKVQLLSLRVGKAMPKDAKPATTSGPEGTELQILVSDPQKQIIGFDDDASRLLRFDDDQGTRLLKSDDEDTRGFPVFSPATISSDRHHCAIFVHSHKTPAPGVVKIFLKGNLVLRCAHGEKSIEQKNISLKKGGIIHLGNQQINISKKAATAINFGFGFGDAKPPQMSVTFNSPSPLDIIKKVEFFSSNGKAIKHQNTGDESMSFGGITCYSLNFGLEQKADAVTIKVTYYEKVEEVTVPVVLETGVGF